MIVRGNKISTNLGNALTEVYTAKNALEGAYIGEAKEEMATYIGSLYAVKAYTLEEIKIFCDNAGFKIEKLEAAKKFRMHLVARKG